MSDTLSLCHAITADMVRSVYAYRLWKCLLSRHDSAVRITRSDSKLYSADKSCDHFSGGEYRDQQRDSHIVADRCLTR